MQIVCAKAQEFPPRMPCYVCLRKGVLLAYGASQQMTPYARALFFGDDVVLFIRCQRQVFNK